MALDSLVSARRGFVGALESLVLGVRLVRLPQRRGLLRHKLFRWPFQSGLIRRNGLVVHVAVVPGAHCRCRADWA